MSTNYREQFAEGEIEAGSLLDVIDQHAQRIADLEQLSGTYKAAWSGYNPLADYMRGLADAGHLPGELGAHFGDIAVKRMQEQAARIAELEAERDDIAPILGIAGAKDLSAVNAALALVAERDTTAAHVASIARQLGDEALQVDDIAVRVLAVVVERDALRARLAEIDRLKLRLKNILEAPSETLSDGKALKEMVRQAKLGLDGK
jgi:hypothetical protein